MLVREFTRVPMATGSLRVLHQKFPRYLENKIGFIGDNKPCLLVSSAKPLPSREGYLYVEMSFECESISTKLQFYNAAIFEVASSHNHFSRFMFPEGRTDEFVLNVGNQRKTVWYKNKENKGTKESLILSQVTEYFPLGIKHILSGLDHIAFLLGLMLLCRNLKEVIYLITGFTIGHSITLGFATLEIVNVDTNVIESLIGFTVALVATEKISQETQATVRLSLGIILLLAGLLTLSLTGFYGLSVSTLLGLGIFSICYLNLNAKLPEVNGIRILLSVLFGFIHGFGFAEVLEKIVPQSNKVLPALFGFNLGVEVGQVLLVLLVLLISKQFSLIKLHNMQRLSHDLLSSALCCAGVYWFISRAMLV